MTELFFKYNKIPYLFDTGKLKLFELKLGQRIEIKNTETIRRVRLGSIEISRERAFGLTTQIEK